MASSHRSALTLLCAKLNDAPGLRELAWRLGVVQRQGKLDIYALVATTILGVAIRGPTAIAQIGHVLAEVTGQRFARSSVWERFTPRFRDLVRHILDEQVREARAREVRLPGVLAGFRDVIAVDATVVKVHDDLADVWRATRHNTMKAALKVHAWVRVFSGELLKFKVTPDAHGDGRAFGVDHDLRGCLVIFDKAYSSPSLWRRIQGVGGFFLSRLPLDRDPQVVRILRRHRGRARKVEGRPLREALRGLQRQIMDVEATFRCQVRKYVSPRNRWVHEDFRLIAVRRPNGTYEVFVTNAPPEMLPAEVVASTYRLRWEVETFFKTAKSGSGLPELPSRKQHIVETLVYASLLRATTSMQALSRFRREVADPLGLAINPGQWQRWWNRQLHGLLDRVIEGSRRLPSEVLAMMLADPNVGRPTNRLRFLASGYLP